MESLRCTVTDLSRRVTKAEENVIAIKTLVNKLGMKMVDASPGLMKLVTAWNRERDANIVSGNDERYPTHLYLIIQEQVDSQTWRCS